MSVGCVLCLPIEVEKFNTATKGLSRQLPRAVFYFIVAARTPPSGLPPNYLLHFQKKTQRKETA